MKNQSIELEFYPKLSEEEINEAIKRIKNNKKNWDAPFFMDVYDHADMDKFRKNVKPFLEDENLKNLIIIGTGGSYQTMKALELFSKRKIYFLTSSRPYRLHMVLKNTSPENSLVIPISRGGKTLDVNSVLPLFKEYKMLALSSRGPMNDMVKDLGATILPVPDLSGRFAASVCSVALVPSLLAGLDVEKFQKGLDDGYNSFKNLDDKENPTLLYAAYLHKLFDKGFRNVFSMPYSKWLEGLVGLFKQEISESSGKEGKGFLGTSQPAPLCQHSVLELLLGGSKGHTTPLLWTTHKVAEDVELKSIETLKQDLGDQTGLSVINYQLDATFQALIEQGVPAAKITLDEVDIYSFGVMIAFIQTMVYHYCVLTDVNWSSNPLVNTGKKICNDAIDNNLSLEQRKKARENVDFEIKKLIL